MKLSICKFVIVLVILMNHYAVAYDAKIDKTVNLSPLIISASKIVVCVPQLYDANDDEMKAIDKLKNKLVILNTDNTDNEPTDEYIETGYLKSEFTPLIVPNKRHFLFLKSKKVDNNYLKKFELPDNAKVYEMFDEYNSSIIMDFRRNSQTIVKLVRDYDINDEETFCRIIGNICKYRSSDLAPHEKIKYLVDLLNSKEGKSQKLYQDNIIPILKHLGAKIGKKGDNYVIKDDAPPQPSEPDEQD